MSYIIQNDNSTDKHGAPMPSSIGPFLFRMDAQYWGEKNLFNGSFNVSPLQDPRSLRRD